MLNQTTHLIVSILPSDSGWFRVGILSICDKGHRHLGIQGNWASEISEHIQFHETRDTVYSFIYFFQPRLQVIRVLPVFFLSPSRPDAPLANPAAIFFFFFLMENGVLLQPTGCPVPFVSFFFIQPFDTSIVSGFDRPRPPAGNGRNSLVRPPTSREKKKKRERVS